MSVDQVDVAHLVEIVESVKVATGDVMQVKVKRVAHPVNLLPRFEEVSAVAVVLLLRHRNIMHAPISTGSLLFDGHCD